MILSLKRLGAARVVSASLSINIASVSANGVDLSSIQSVGWSVCRSVCQFVRKVYCGKTADWYRMPFVMVSGVGRGMGALDSSPRAPRGSGDFGEGVAPFVSTAYLFNRNVFDSCAKS